jgi:hypothetical protein
VHHQKVAAGGPSTLSQGASCGDLDVGLDGDRVWMACTCGAVINRCADDD